MLCRLETQDPPSPCFGGLGPRLPGFDGLAAEMKRKTNENALLEIGKYPRSSSKMLQRPGVTGQSDINRYVTKR